MRHYNSETGEKERLNRRRSFRPSTSDSDPFSFQNLYRGAIGFEPILKQFQELNEHLPKIPNYPPYNIKKVDEEHFVIEMAVAGFTKNTLDIELKDGILSIGGKIEPDISLDEYIYKGIADRAFLRQFTVAEKVEVKNAELANGMLKIFLERIVPDAEKPRKIDIMDPFGVGEATKQLLNEGVKVWSDAIGAFINPKTGEKVD